MSFFLKSKDLKKIFFYIIFLLRIILLSMNFLGSVYCPYKI